MKNILKSTLMLVLGLGLFSACSDDNDSNPTVKEPTTFVLNTPALANAEIDLANSDVLELTCSQPDYGFPARTLYHVQVAVEENGFENGKFIELSQYSESAKIQMDAQMLASDLTNMMLEMYGKTEADFPMNIKAYMRVRAVMANTLGTVIEGTEIISNVVSFSNLRLEFSLPPVEAPAQFFITGKFCGWDWNTALSMVVVNGSPNLFWHLVYIDTEQGIKFNSDRAWDGNEVGYAKLNSVGGDLADEIISSGDGNILSTVGGWYLMIVKVSVSGRDILYDVKFNKPEVWLMGPCIGDESWSELYPAGLFTIEKAEGESTISENSLFVSPAFVGVPQSDQGCRAYVKIPDNEWWRSEFMVFDNKIEYRADGGDQDRVLNSVGQKLYLNFTKETGEFK